jgi:single-stranded DNA-binding protein
MSNVSDTNRVELSGELQRIDMKYIPSGAAICNFTLKNISGKRTAYIYCKAWEEVGLRVGGMRDGDYLEVQGRLEVEVWNDKNGEKKTKTVVNVFNLGSPVSEQPKQTAKHVKAELVEDVPDEDIPF